VIDCYCEKLNEIQRPGTATRNIREPFIPQRKKTNNERCPVQLYRAFSQHRPDEMKQPDSSFFLAIKHRRQPGSQIWYNKFPLGKNEIGKFLSKAAKAAKLLGNITNHSVRKPVFLVSWMSRVNTPENYVAQQSDHKNLKSLDSYKSASTAHQRKMSFVSSRSGASFSATNQAPIQPNESQYSLQQQNLLQPVCSRRNVFRSNISKDRKLSFNFFSTRVKVRSEFQNWQKRLFPKKASYLERRQ
jgi:hypothetical protein